jgi:dihydrofolate synthase/folylpolyglutamate synthase
VAVLEVGLGGRLDAFNLVDADVAVITSISLEHQTFLGDDVEAIGREKAGVMRPGQRVVLGPDVTESVVQRARQLGCHHTRLGSDFHVAQRADGWDFIGSDRRIENLPLGSLAPANCALAIEAAAHLATLYHERVGSALTAATLPGRMETWYAGGEAGCRPLILDVAHNPAGARFLAVQLALRHPGRRFVALLGMLADKDSAGVAAAVGEQVGSWICLSTSGPRGLSGADLAARLGAEAADGRRCEAMRDPAQALSRALSWCEPGDGILAFGSFDVVEQMRAALMAGHAGARACSPDEPMGFHR